MRIRADPDPRGSKSATLCPTMDIPMTDSCVADYLGGHTRQGLRYHKVSGRGE